MIMARPVDGLGNFGFPWLFVGTILVNAAQGGWDYYRTKKQIEMAKQSAPTEITSPSDIQAISGEVRARTGTQLPESRLQKYISDLLQGNPPPNQQIPPGQLLSVGQPPWQGPQSGGGMPTWGWALLGVAGFFVLQGRRML